MKAVLVASGGMDSATLAWLYRNQGYDMTLVGFNYGQRHVKELDSLAKIGERLDATVRVLDMSFLAQHLSNSALTSTSIDVPDGHYAEANMKATVVPNRNAIMLAVAAGIAVNEGAEVVATGVHAGDHFIYPDCRPRFIEAINLAFQLGNEGFAKPGFRIEAPFVYLTKAQIAAQGNELCVDFSITWSCYKGGDVHCGTCGTCIERKEAFDIAGVPDPTIYATTETQSLYKKPNEGDNND